jgi:hypothetical protein
MTRCCINQRLIRLDRADYGDEPGRRPMLFDTFTRHFMQPRPSYGFVSAWGRRAEREEALWAGGSVNSRWLARDQLRGFLVSRYEDLILPDWDRSHPAGDLVDIGTGTPIWDIDHNGGWIRFGGRQPPRAMAIRPSTRRWIRVRSIQCPPTVPSCCCSSRE